MAFKVEKAKVFLRNFESRRRQNESIWMMETAQKPKYSGDLMQRLGKMIAMLGSENDGEVLSAARSMQKALKADGLDLNDLASVFRVGGLSGVGVQVDTIFVLQQMLDEARAQEWCLASGDREFLASLRPRLVGVGPTPTTDEISRLQRICRDVRKRSGV